MGIKNTLFKYFTITIRRAINFNCKGININVCPIDQEVIMKFFVASLVILATTFVVAQPKTVKAFDLADQWTTFAGCSISVESGNALPFYSVSSTILAGKGEKIESLQDGVCAKLALPDHNAWAWLPSESRVVTKSNNLLWAEGMIKIMDWVPVYPVSIKKTKEPGSSKTDPCADSVQLWCT
jgi:hypothetical protein